MPEGNAEAHRLLHKINSENHRHNRYRYHRQQCGDKGTLCHYGLVSAVLKAEHRAERGDRHGGYHCVDADDTVVEQARKTEQVHNEQRQDEKAECRHQKNLRAAGHVLQRNLRDAVANYQQRAGHGYVADERERLRYYMGHSDGKSHDYHADVRSNHRRRIESLPLKLTLRLACNKLNSPDKHAKGICHVEDTGIEHSLRAEHRRHNGIADEAHISEGEHEAEQSFLLAHVEQARQIGCNDEQHDIRYYADNHQRKDELAAWQIVAHSAGYDKARTSKVDNKTCHLLAKCLVEQLCLAAYVAGYNNGKQHSHLLKNNSKIHSVTQ